MTTTLITGGNKSLGFETARRLKGAGHRVVIGARDAERGRRAAEELGVEWVQLDVTSDESVATAAKEVRERFGGLDVLVNNAGIAGPTGRVEDIAPEDWDRCLAVCLTGQFNCARLAVPHLRASANPSIVNLSSAAGQFGFALRSPYSAAKWGVIGVTKSLAIELGPEQIRVNAILPGLVAPTVGRQRRHVGALAERRESGPHPREDAIHLGRIEVRNGTEVARADLPQAPAARSVVAMP